mmetsp:Transcript_106378/g.174614  ORF Transcript_106378/g.174614 Transcript_106378/m.174614 type:complete len:152 (+) Transcript_106378:93-548(+)
MAGLRSVRTAGRLASVLSDSVPRLRDAPLPTRLQSASASNANLRSFGRHVDRLSPCRSFSTSLREEKSSVQEGIPGQPHRDIWLPHDIIPIGSPIFFVALVLIPVIIWQNEKMDERIEEENVKLREERVRRKAEKEARESRAAGAATVGAA